MLLSSDMLISACVLFTIVSVCSFAAEEFVKLTFEDAKSFYTVNTSVTLIFEIVVPASKLKTHPILWYHHRPMNDSPTFIGEDTKVYDTKLHTNYHIELTESGSSTFSSQQSLSSSNKRLRQYVYKFHFRPVLWSDRGTWSVAYDQHELKANLSIIVPSVIQPLVIETSGVLESRVHLPIPVALLPDSPLVYTYRPDGNNVYLTPSEPVNHPGSSLRPFDLRGGKLPYVLRFTCSTSCSYPVKRLTWTLKNTTHEIVLRSTDGKSTTEPQSNSGGAHFFTRSCDQHPGLSQSVSQLTFDCQQLGVFGLLRVECSTASATHTSALTATKRHQPQKWLSVQKSYTNIRNLTMNLLGASFRRTSTDLKERSPVIFVLCPARETLLSGIVAWEFAALALLFIFYTLSFLILVRKIYLHYRLRQQHRQLQLRSIDKNIHPGNCCKVNVSEEMIAAGHHDGESFL